MAHPSNCFDPIPFQSLLSKRSAEREAFERRMNAKEIRSVTWLKPEMVLYTLKEDEARTVHCLDLSDKYRNHHVYHPTHHPHVRLPLTYRNKVVRIFNLSYEHKVRIGILLEDRTIHVSILDQNQRTHWYPKGSIEASFDLMRADRMVYSRTADALYWPLQTEKGKWDIYMCSVDGRKQRVIMRGLPECSLQTLRDELVVLFHRHGTLFVEYRQMPDSRNYRGATHSYRTQGDPDETEVQQRSPSDRKPSSRDGAPLATGLSLQATYWNPERSEISTEYLDKFEPIRTRTEMRGFCHCKDSKSEAQIARNSAFPNRDIPLKTVVLYGDTIFKLTAQTCTVLMNIQIPDGFENFKLMYLGRIVVLQTEKRIAGYMNSERPVKIREGDFMHAGYGIVCNCEGIFRIKMSEPKYESEVVIEREQ